ncbi:MAG: sulfite exporter TauE/SafE family protein [Myxococcales bacterium]|jgi:sulfite exporter TauE/SafE
MYQQAILAGAAAGLLSSVHCAGMCGPLCAAACGRSPGWLAPARYQLGRLLGYAFVGSLAGQLGAALTESPLVAVAPGVLGVLVGGALLLLAARLWRDARATPAVPADSDPGLVRLGRGPRGPRLLSTLVRLLPREPTALGAISVLLPCGALAAGVLLAAGTGDRVAGALTLGAFATTSGLGVLGGSLLLSQLSRLRGAVVGRALALALALAAALVVLRPLYVTLTPNPGSVETSAAAPCH